MNCQEFENIVNDLAAGWLWDGLKREHGLAHAGECARCSARLANERLLSFELGAVVREERLIRSPLRLKQDLMAAFAIEHAAPVAPMAPLAAVVPFPSRNRTAYWVLAIAAAIILALALFLPLRGWFTPSANHTAQETPAPAAPVTPKNDLAAPAVDPNKTSTPANDVVAIEPKPVAPARVVRQRKLVQPRAETNLANSELIASNTELTSGFIPLTYLDSATAAENGVVLRVEVSRDKLAAMGLPLNLDRSGETIKADIILGDDGVARAIRLVQ
ncbi:MAG: hypothetical protein ABIP75_17850 [Pyrinomonadaceae bacterium]